MYRLMIKKALKPTECSVALIISSNSFPVVSLPLCIICAGDRRDKMHTRNLLQHIVFVLSTQ